MAKIGGALSKNVYWHFCLFIFAFCLLPFASSDGKVRSEQRNELPAPANLQLVVLQKTITLSWQWQPPEELPAFKEFGYDVKRQDGKVQRVTGVTFSDPDLFPSTYTYWVRVHGTAKEKGKPVDYVSDWTGPVSGTVAVSCPRPPKVTLAVEPTQKRYSSIPSLRFHLQGQVSIDPSCTLRRAAYHLDTGTGILHTGPLSVDRNGHFDTFVNAFGPEDEIPAGGRASFAITATAEDEAGPTTSSATTIDVNLENPFAPHSAE